MPSIRDIFVRLGIQSDPRGFQRATQGINQLKNSAVLLGQLLTTGVVAVGFKRMIDVASDIEETANKFGAVFGQAGEGVQRQLEDIADRTGATNLQLQQMSSNIGALIKPALGSARAAGQMSTRVAELALDIASFNNVSAEDALTALRSGLIGSAEPLQRFGVDTRVAALEQEALRRGIKGSVKDMKEGQRIALRFAAIQRQLGAQGATGDATKTAEDFANASRNLGQALKETFGIIGTFFLRSVGGLVNRMRDLINTFQEWLAENRKLIQQRIDKFFDRSRRVIAAVVDLSRRAITATREWLNNLTGLGAMFIRLSALAAALAVLLALPGGSLLLLLALVGLIIEDFETWRRGGESLIGDLLDSLDTLRQRLGITEEAVSAIGSVFSAVFGAMQDALFIFIQAWIDLFTEGPIEAAKNMASNTLMVFKDLFGDILSTAAEFWADLGKQFTDFLTSGLRTEGGGVLGRAFTAAQRALGFGQAAAGQRATASPAAARGSGAIDQSRTEINVAVTAQPGMSEQDLAEMIPREIQKAQQQQNQQTARSFAIEAP